MPNHINGNYGNHNDYGNYNAIVPSAPQLHQASFAPATNNLMNFIAQQVAHFTQSHLASHANQFANSVYPPVPQMDLGPMLQDFAQQLMHAMHPGGHESVSGSDNYDGGMNYQNFMHQKSQEMKEQDGRNKLHLKGMDNGNAYV